MSVLDEFVKANEKESASLLENDPLCIDMFDFLKIHIMTTDMI